MLERTIDPDILPVAARTRLGESPWWDGGLLSWVDILGQKILRCDLSGSELSILNTPGEPGFAIPSDGGYVVGLPDGAWFCNSCGTWEQLWLAPHDPRTFRMNDAKTDPKGLLWLGSMTYAEEDPVASLYRMDRARVVTHQIDGITTSNGLGWSPDGCTMYYTDSIPRVIWACDFDLNDSVLSNPRIFAQDSSGCVPDGLAVDDEGCVWSAKWDGNRIVRYRPDGKVEQVLHVPVARPTSCTFVGPDRSLLAVTTASPTDPSRSHDLDGAVLLIPTETTGPMLSSVVIEGRK